MGYIKHHTIVVTAWSEEKIKDVHSKAKEIFKEEFAKEVAFNHDGSLLVSPLIQGMTNGQLSFFVAPDGSKEGWQTSDLGNAARERLVNYIISVGYDDGSNSVSFVEVFFGEDNGYCEVVNHN